MNAGFTLMLVLIPVFIFRTLQISKKKSVPLENFSIVLPLVVFQIYRMFIHSFSFSKIVYALFLLSIIFAIAFETINVSLIVKFAAYISALASSLLVVQYIFYYLMKIHIQLVPVSLLHADSEQWVLLAKTGLYGITGVRSNLYRPSAFFLEPSHMFLYCFPVLCVLLLHSNVKAWQFKMAVFVSVGMILSTSGLGIATAIGVWILYLVLYSRGTSRDIFLKIKRVISPKTLAIMLALLLLLLVLYFNFSFFKGAVNRVLGINRQKPSRAIEGRIQLASNLVKKLSGKTLLFGLTEDF